MLQYRQATGELFLLQDGKWVLIGTGYSGHGAGLNSHEQEDSKGVGPIPCGLWGLSLPYQDEHLGPICFRLVAMTYKGPRNLFRIHGDNSQMNHTASDGCVILAHDIRQKLADLKVSYMVVVA